MSQTLALRLTGFILSIILSLATYFLVINHQFFELQVGTTITVIILLAAFQAIVQFLLFLDIWREEGARWNWVVLISTLCVLFIIIAFSIWVMRDLDYNMMPMHH